MSYYDRYREALGKPIERRTDALISGVQSLARSQAQTEYQILSNLDPIIEGELQDLIKGQVAAAAATPATQWDLLRSAQTQRLAIVRAAGDLRTLQAAAICLIIGIAIGIVGTIVMIRLQQLQPIVIQQETTPWQ